MDIDTTREYFSHFPILLVKKNAILISLRFPPQDYSAEPFSFICRSSVWNSMLPLHIAYSCPLPNVLLGCLFLSYSYVINLNKVRIVNVPHYPSCFIFIIFLVWVGGRQTDKHRQNYNFKEARKKADFLCIFRWKRVGRDRLPQISILTRG